MVSSTSVYIWALVAAVLVVVCECQNLQFPSGDEDDRPTLTASMTSSTEKPAANPEVPVVFRPSCSGCQYTQQYNPVCGSDGQTYANVYILNCERFCGKNVRMVVHGGCSANRG